MDALDGFDPVPVTCVTCQGTGQTLVFGLVKRTCAKCGGTGELSLLFPSDISREDILAVQAAARKLANRP